MKTLTTYTLNVEIDLSKLQSKKGLSICVGDSSSLTVKPVMTSDLKDNGKGVHVEPSTEERNKLLELEME